MDRPTILGMYNNLDYTLMKGGPNPSKVEVELSEMMILANENYDVSNKIEVFPVFGSTHRRHFTNRKLGARIGVGFPQKVSCFRSAD